MQQKIDVSRKTSALGGSWSLVNFSKDIDSAFQEFQCNEVGEVIIKRLLLLSNPLKRRSDRMQLFISEILDVHFQQYALKHIH